MRETNRCEVGVAGCNTNGVSCCVNKVWVDEGRCVWRVGSGCGVSGCACCEGMCAGCHVIAWRGDGGRCGRRGGVCTGCHVTVELGDGGLRQSALLQRGHVTSLI